MEQKNKKTRNGVLEIVLLLLIVTLGVGVFMQMETMRKSLEESTAQEIEVEEIELSPQGIIF